MLVCLIGDRYVTYGGFKIRKVILPFCYVILSSVMTKNASFSGHMFGIVAAFVVKYGGLFEMRLLPRYEWITDYEKDSYLIQLLLSKQVSYFTPTDYDEGFRFFLTTWITKTIARLDALRRAASNMLAFRQHRADGANGCVGVPQNQANLSTGNSSSENVSSYSLPSSTEMQSMPISSDNEPSGANGV